MPGLTYLKFVLVVKKAAKDYLAEVVDSPAGRAQVSFRFPFTEDELKIFFLQAGQVRKGMRRVDTPEMELARQYGNKLFKAVFQGEVYAAFRSSSDQARRENKGLRLQIQIEDARLACLPWEYLYNPNLNRFLSQGNDTPVVRYLDLPEPVRPLEARLPLKLLVVIANPRGMPPLEVEGEWQRLKQALDPLIRKGVLKVERLENPSLELLQNQLLRRGPYHILHFIGHGAYDAQAQESLLVFEDGEGAAQMAGGQRLGTILHNHPSLRLVVLNACEGGRASQEDPFAGVAQSLVQQGLPAVIAMQFPITDTAALTFTKNFYTALAEGYPLDAALAEARVAIFASGNDIEWGTPVLFTRLEDGKLFDFPPEPVPIPPRLPNRLWYAGATVVVLILTVFGLNRAGVFNFAPSPSATETGLVTPVSPEPSFTASPPTQAVEFSPTPFYTHTVTSQLPTRHTATSSPAATVTSTRAHTRTPTQTPLPSLTPTPTATPFLPLPNQIKTAIAREALLEMTRNPRAADLEAIFLPGARVFSLKQGEQWAYQDFYRLSHPTITENRHENLVIQTFTAERIVLLSDNCRVYKQTEKIEPEGNILGNQWAFRSVQGVWKIENLWIERNPPLATTYSFEDGTLGCWNISGEEGKALGVSLANSTDLAHEGNHALALEFNLAPAPGEPRTRVEHYTSGQLPKIQKLSAWVYLSFESQEAPLLAEFFIWDGNLGNWGVSSSQEIRPRTWTRLEAANFYSKLPIDQVVMLGIEFKLPAGTTDGKQGTAFIDQIQVEIMP